MKAPYLSVVVANRDKAEYLPGFLGSLVGGTFRDLEIILVDDASTDGSVAVARAYPAELIESAPQRGPAYCRNLGARRARGEVLVFCDSDTVLAPRSLEVLAGHFRTKRIDALVGNPLLPPLKDNRIGYFCILEMQEHVWRLGFDAGPVDAWGTTLGAVRRELFESLGGFNEGFRAADVEDFELSFRFPASAVVYFDKEVGFRHSYEGLAAAIRKAARRAFFLGNMERPLARSGYLGSRERAFGYALSLAAVLSGLLCARSRVFLAPLSAALAAQAWHSRTFLARAREAGGGGLAAYCFLLKILLPLPVAAGFASGRLLRALGWRKIADRA